jgi:hypothetical protein
LRERHEELLAKKIKVVVITFEAGFLARRYLEETGLDWPLLIDETRQVYHAYTMLEAGFWDIWGFSSWMAYFKEMRHGQWPKKSSGDIHQRGGDVLIDPDGIVRLHHIGKGPADRPRIEDILRLVP